MRFAHTLTVVVTLLGTAVIAQDVNYEDPFLLNTIAERMAEHTAEMREMGVEVTHVYKETSMPNVPNGPSDGAWEGRAGFANVPNTPSVANFLIMEEEFAHAMGSNGDAYSTEPVNMLWEEFRAKHLAVLMVGGYITPNVAAFNDLTIARYIQFAREMSQYTRVSYTDEIVAEIRADAEEAATAQFISGVVELSTSGTQLAAYYAR